MDVSCRRCLSSVSLPPGEARLRRPSAPVSSAAQADSLRLRQHTPGSTDAGTGARFAGS